MSQPLGQCSGCGGLLFANVFHVCPANVHLYQGTIPQEELDKLVAGSYVPPPPAASDSGVFAEPPELVHKTGRTHCEHCEEPLHPDVYHKCAGNEEYTPPPIVMPSLANYTGVCPQCHGKKPEPGTQVEACALCGGSGVIG
jgi:hypothetical protein